jgi:hypothetical protein
LSDLKVKVTLSEKTRQGWGNLGELVMKRPSMQIGLGIALGTGIGIAVAVAIGSGGAWLAIGIALGMVIGTSISKKKARLVGDSK